MPLVYLRRVVKPKITSSLDLFLLALIESGVSTAYAFKEQAGLSVGATLPALRRLEKYGFLVRGEKLDRNRQDLELTRAGKRELKSATERFLRDYQRQSPPDTESVLRICALALANRKTRAAIKILSLAAKEWSIRADETPGRSSEPVADMAASYGKMSAFCGAAACSAQAEALSLILQELNVKGR